MYFPRRSTLSTRSPSSIAATIVGSSGRVSRGSAISTASSVRPSSFAARRVRSVSTSGSSGISGRTESLPVVDHVEQDAPPRRRLVAELVGGCDLAHRGSSARLIARMDLGQHVALRDDVAALAHADDADGVIDVVVLRPPAGAEAERRIADLHRSQPHDRAPALGDHLANDGCLLERAFVRRPTLRLEPAAPGGLGRAVRDGGLGEAPPFIY